MIDHHDAHLTLRAQLLTLSAVTTGSTSLSATSTGYERSAGSWIDDGFRVGMDVEGTGFTNGANNASKVVTAVATLTLTCAGNVAEGAGTRTVFVGLPSGRAWENVAFVPTDGRPYVAEEYLPGPVSQETLGTTAQLEVLPSYVLRVNVPENYGMDAARKYADGLLTLFAPGTTLTLANGDVLRVRRDTAPFVGQLIPRGDGFAHLSVTVPLRLRTANTI